MAAHVAQRSSDLGLLGGLMRKQADDPVGLAFTDDRMFRLFVMHICGVRQDCVGARRGRRPNAVTEQVWDNSAAATTRLGIAGPPKQGTAPWNHRVGLLCMAIGGGGSELSGINAWWSYVRKSRICSRCA